MLVPETETVDRRLRLAARPADNNALEAIATGTVDGLKLALIMGGMLLVFISLIALANAVLTDWIGNYTGLNPWVAQLTAGQYPVFNLQFVAGMLFAPLAWLIGVSGPDVLFVGQLLGEKVVINEFVAYVSLSQGPAQGQLDPHSQLVATYALCGFANFSSIGVQLGGIGTLAPNQRPVLAQLGIWSLVGGTVACLMTAVIAGALV